MLPTLLSLAAVPALVYAHYPPVQSSSFEISTVVYQTPVATSTEAAIIDEEDCDDETATEASISFTSTADSETTIIVSETPSATSTEAAITDEEDCDDETATEASISFTSTADSETTTIVSETPAATTEEEDCDDETSTQPAVSETTTPGSGWETTMPDPDSEASTVIYEAPTSTEGDDCDETETARSSSDPKTTLGTIYSTETGSESSVDSSEYQSTTDTPVHSTETGSESSFVSDSEVTSSAAQTTSAPETLTSMFTTTNVYTITSCAPTVTNCPVGSVTTEIVTSYTTWCPATETESTSVPTLDTMDIPVSVTPSDNSGESTTTTTPYETLTSTITTSKVYIITSCAPTVTNCPVGSVTTEVLTSHTAYVPGTTAPVESTGTTTLTKTKTRVYAIPDCAGDESCTKVDITTEIYTATQVVTKETAATYTIQKTVGCSEGEYDCVAGSSATTYLETVPATSKYPEAASVVGCSTCGVPSNATSIATTVVGFYTSMSKGPFVPETTAHDNSGSEPSSTPSIVPASGAAWNVPGFSAVVMGVLIAVAI